MTRYGPCEGGIKPAPITSRRWRLSSWLLRQALQPMMGDYRRHRHAQLQAARSIDGDAKLHPASAVRASTFTTLVS
jgi:hypothetical protein